MTVRCEDCGRTRTPAKVGGHLLVSRLVQEPLNHLTAFIGVRRQRAASMLLQATLTREFRPNNQ